MKTHYDNKEVLITEIEHGSDYCDSYIVSAEYVETGEELDDNELDELTELCADILYDDWYERQACEFYDAAKDASKYGE
jgi:hypothetical protein